ncbi:MAG: ABC transporter ATP-binding protein [Lachnospiraceae bacterium]
MEEKVIQIKNVTKIYKLYTSPMERLKDALRLTRKQNYEEYYALQDVSFDVYKGETVGLIGTNGAGKSTLLKIITGVLTQSSGEVNVKGKISALLELGAGFNQEYTGIQNIYLNGSMMGYTKEQMDERVGAITEFAGIGDYINQPVKTYSSGMFARLAFAVAINVEPDILIVDEALSVGDIYFQSKCFQKMNEIKQNGTTILLVTHDMSAMVKYCDRAIVLNHGTKIKEGNPKEMVDIYKKILVNQYDENEDEAKETEPQAEEIRKPGTYWKDQLRINEENDTYGTQKISIVDFGIFDETDRITNLIMKKSSFTVKMRVEVAEDVENPIFAFTIKNVRGQDVTGTNTMFERKDLELAKKGESYEISFSQKAMMQGGEYLVSFGCTGYVDGEFTVYDRLYDITNLTVISQQDTVGFFDLDSQVEITKC